MRAWDVDGMAVEDVPLELSGLPQPDIRLLHRFSTQVLPSTSMPGGPSLDVIVQSKIAYRTGHAGSQTQAVLASLGRLGRIGCALATYSPEEVVQLTPNPGVFFKYRSNATDSVLRAQLLDSELAVTSEIAIDINSIVPASSAGNSVSVRMIGSCHSSTGGMWLLFRLRIADIESDPAEIQGAVRDTLVLYSTANNSTHTLLQLADQRPVTPSIEQYCLVRSESRLPELEHPSVLQLTNRSDQGLTLRVLQVSAQPTIIEIPQFPISEVLGLVVEEQNPEEAKFYLQLATGELAPIGE